MEALAPFLDCGPAPVWLLEREVMNKLCQSSCLGRRSSLECKQGNGEQPFSSSQNICWPIWRKKVDVRKKPWLVYNGEAVCHLPCDNSDLWSSTVPDITNHITDGRKLKKDTTCVKQGLM